MAKLPTFSGKTGKILGFLIACRLFIRMKIRNNLVEEQVQEGSADIWNIMEYLESRILSYIIVEKFLSDLKEEFGEGDDKTMKVAKLKKVEQGGKTMEEFVQEYKRAARKSEYERKLLIEEFKREINGTIRRNLIEVERPSRSIEQWYERTTNLDKYWKESR